MWKNIKVYISCGKDGKWSHKSLSKASKVVFTMYWLLIANASVYTPFLYIKKQFYKNKSLGFEKKVRSKLGHTGLLSHKTQEQSV